MRIRHNVAVALLMTVALTVLLGGAYPLIITALAQTLLRDRANGQLIERDGRMIGSALVGQRFTSERYFHGRASAAGEGYDAVRSGGTNLGPTNKKLIASVRMAVDAARKDNPRAAIPIDLVTTSASGLDPDISPDAAMFQIPRVASARGLDEGALRALVVKCIEGRQLGFLGEPRVNVLLLNLALDARASQASVKR